MSHPRAKIFATLLLLCLGLSLAVSAESPQGQPQDPYFWLEQENPRREEWIGRQSERTDLHLRENGRQEEFFQRLMRAYGADQARDWEGHPIEGPDYQLRWSKKADQQHQILSKIETESESPTVVFDPNLWPSSERPTWSVLSPDKRYLAYGRATSGQQTASLELLDLQTSVIVCTIPGARTRQQPVWSSDGDHLYIPLRGEHTGIYRYALSERALQLVSEHSLGPYGEFVEHDGLVVFTSAMDGPEDEQCFLRRPNGRVTELPLRRGATSFAAAEGTLFILTSTESHNQSVVRIDLDEWKTQPGRLKEVAAERADRTLISSKISGKHLIVESRSNALPGFSVYDFEGRFIQDFQSPEPGAFSNFRSESPTRLSYTWSTLVEPGLQRILNLDSGETTDSTPSSVPGFSPQDYTVRREWYQSEDGTRVPITIAHHKDLVKNQSNPTHLYVYGCCGRGVTTDFSVSRIPFLEAQGVYAIAHLRGGNELGENWHDQATGEHRSLVHQDLSAALRFLVKEGYTTPSLLSLDGGSAGAMLVGVATTQYPELFRAGVGVGGLFDMLNYERLGGASWSTEFGSITKPEELNSLAGWSPLQNIESNIRYPDLLLTVGRHDDLVNPCHSYKFVAKLHTARASEDSAYLRVEGDLGHGYGASTEAYARRYAAQWSFILQRTKK